MSKFYSYEKVEVKSMIGFVCDKCQRYISRDTKDVMEGIVETQEALYWNQTCGYGSIWGDGNELELSLCQHCAFEILSPYVKVTHKDINGEVVESDS